MTKDQVRQSGLRYSWRQLRPLVAPSRGGLAALAGASAVSGFLEAGILVLLVQIAFAIADGSSEIELGTGLGSNATVSLSLLFLLAVLMGLLRLALQIATARLAPRMSANVQIALRRQAVRGYLDASWERQASEHEGRFQHLATSEIGQIGAAVLIAGALLTAGFNLAALLATAFIVNAVAALVVILSLAVLAVLLRPLARLSRRASAQYMVAQRSFSASVADLVRMSQELKVFGVENEVDANTGALIDRSGGAFRRKETLNRLVPAIYHGLALLLVISCLAVVAGLDVANVQALGAVVLLLLRALTYGQGLQNGIHRLNDLLPFVERVSESEHSYRDEKEPETGDPTTEIGSLTLSDVSFEYAPGEPVLQDISATVRPGECIGVVGPSGAGKSTLVQLLLRLREPTNGQLLVDGAPASDIEISSWRDLVSYVPQDPQLIAGSVRDNITFFRDGFDENAVQSAATRAHLDQAISEMPHGYDTIIGPRDKALSGGQRQRICIARALLGDPAVLVLDEPTSALDLRSERAIRETIEEMSGRVTVMIIAHRGSTLSICDRIMVMEEGRLTAFEEAGALEDSSSFFADAIAMSLSS